VAPGRNDDFAAWLDRASPLRLHSVPSSAAAKALVHELTTLVLSDEEERSGRVQRGAALTARLRQAVGGLVGGLLLSWARSVPTPTYRKMQAASFTGSPVGRRQFQAVVNGLRRAGFVAVKDGMVRPPIEWEPGVTSWQGRVTRLWPTTSLLALATQHGVVATTVRDDFLLSPPAKPPSVPKVPVEVLGLKEKAWGRLDAAPSRGRPLPLGALGETSRALVAEVAEMNTLAAGQAVTGCLPPRWIRIFRANELLGGRWQALGTDGVYQQMSETDRLTNIRINGERVAEVDVAASHLSIMHGLLRLQLPEGDLYQVAGVSRDVAKSWVLMTLGKGSPVTRWSSRALARASTHVREQLLSHDARRVAAAICERYPFLKDPAGAVGDRAGLTAMHSLGSPASLLALRLQAIEARALTTAMLLLARRNPEEGGPVLSLPVHDSLIVPQSAAKDADWLIKGAFSYQAWGRVSHEAGCTVATTIDVAAGR